MQVRARELGGLAAVELATARLEVLVVTGAGPRIASFGPRGGRSLLFWDAAKTHRRGAWRLFGGHRVWVTRPLADESEEAYAEDNLPCEVIASERGVTAIGAAHPVYKLRRSLAVELLSDDTLLVKNRIENAGDMLWSGGVWGLTCTLPREGTTYGIPLGDDSAWDSFSVVIPRRWGGGHTSLVNDPQLRFTEDCLIVRPAGRECKRMLQAPRGLIGMTDPGERVSFLKKTEYVPGASYPLGTNLAIYIGPGNFMVEMESMGPERALKPGEALESVERWALRPPVDWSEAGARNAGIDL
jgi:hypothetical protein